MVYTCDGNLQLHVYCCELRVFKKKHKNSENHFTCNAHVKFSLDLIFCLAFIFNEVTTVISPKDVLIETESEFPYVWYNAGKHP